MVQIRDLSTIAQENAGSSTGCDFRFGNSRQRTAGKSRSISIIGTETSKKGGGGGFADYVDRVEPFVWHSKSTASPSLSVLNPFSWIAEK